MATESLGQIFSSSTTKKLQLLYDQVKNSGILEPVGTEAFSLKELTFDSGDTQVKFLDLAATFDAKSTVQASIDAPTTQIAPFDKTDPVSAPTGTSYAILNVGGQLTAGLSGAVSNLPLSISAAAAAGFTYTHYLPVAATDTRVNALTKLVTTAELPNFASITGMANGEVSSVDATLNIDLGVKGKYGSSFDLAGTLDLFKGLSAQLTASVEYAIEASLGWSLNDELTLIVASAQQKNAGWTRVRIDRSHTNCFTAGATFALQINYDASSLASVLEKVFAMSPLPRVLDILEQVQTTTWDQLGQKLADRASQDLISYIAGTGWKEKAADSEEVQAALAAINKVVSTYNTIDTKVQQLWGALLTKANLQPGSPLRTAIDKIAALDPKNPDLQQFLSPTAQKDAELLESLTGKSIEQLLVGSSVAVQTAISTAINLAKQLERVINDTPNTIVDAIDKFSTDHGVKSAITFLSDNATSLDKIQAFGDSAIQKIVEKAVGKVFTAIGDDEYKKVQAWATKILAEWQKLSDQLAAAAKFLKGTVGFNVGLEFSRVTESSAVLDLEVNPANASAVSAVRDNLKLGNVQGMLKALNGIKPDDQGALPYLIRESMIVSRHVRTGATSVLLSLFGLANLQKVTGQRFDESQIQITMTGRTGSFNGGFVQGVQVTDSSSECGAWVAADATDASIDVTAPFSTVSRAMHLTFARTDNASTDDEIKAITTLLVDLGFFATGAANPMATAGAQTSFTMDIVLDENAVKTFVADDGEANWNNDYRNAAYRLLKDDLIAEKIPSLNQPTGEVLAAVVKTDLFTDTWTDTSTTKFRQDPRAKTIGIGGKTLQILDNTTNQFIPPYIPIQMLITRRPGGIGALKSVGTALTASASAKEADLAKLVENTAAFFAKTSFPEWDNPMFNFWFVVARLRRLGAAVLANAKGYATFRTRATANDAWSNPQQWSLTAGQGVFIPDNKKPLLFPF